MKVKGNIDLLGGELRNAVTQNLSTAPSSPLSGRRYYDTTSGWERYWNGTRWVNATDSPSASNVTGLGALALLNTVGAAQIDVGAITNTQISASAAIALSKLATDPLARANHTGTQTASTISDFNTAVQTSRLDQMSTPTGNVSLGSQRITNLGAPSTGSDAATKTYVDNAITGLDWKASVRVASTANVSVTSAPSAIDGVILASGDRILLKAQTTGTENGLYTFASAGAALTRATDADSNSEVTTGLAVFVSEGTVNADSAWTLTTSDPIVLGGSSLTFAQFSGGGTVTGTTNRISVTGSQVDIASNYVGQASITTLGTITTGTWTGTAVAVANGGTGATTAAGARTNLGAVGKYTNTFGDGSATSFAFTHGLGTVNVLVELYEVSTGDTVYADVHRTSTTVVTVDGFTTAPTTGSLGVTIVG